ncbi:MAG: hypothetical protein KKI08_00840 [Armatimonadetes bacterium]|nr:hypothetical protein [Armatimonadota bacterium]
MRKVLIAALLVAAALPALAQDTGFYTPPVVSVPKVATAPRLDGIIEPNEWAAAVPLSPLVLVGGRALPTRPTSVFIMYDEHNLYIGAILNDPGAAQLKADTAERDGPVWEDDDLELFFDTDDQRKSYIHLAVNSKGIQYDALMKDKTADYRWRAEAAVMVDGWSVELELPFANDLAPAPGIAWGLSVARHVASDGELSTWDRTLKSFHDVAEFGSMVFATEPLSLQVASLGSLWLGKNTAQLVLQNTGNQAFTGKINTRVMSRDKYGHFFGVTKVTVPPTGRISQDVPYSIYQDGFSTVTYSLTDGTGKTVWRTAPYPVMTPEVAPNIAAVEKTLAAATRAWAMLPRGEAKTRLQGDLDALTVQWRYLIAQYRDRAKVSRTELEGLAQFADKLRGEAEMLENQIKAAKMTGALPSFTVAGVTSLQHVFGDERSVEPGVAPTLDACRNETEALQVVVLPFR